MLLSNILSFLAKPMKASSCGWPLPNSRRICTYSKSATQLAWYKRCLIYLEGSSWRIVFARSSPRTSRSELLGHSGSSIGMAIQRSNNRTVKLMKLFCKEMSKSWRSPSLRTRSEVFRERIKKFSEEPKKRISKLNTWMLNSRTSKRTCKRWKACSKNTHHGEANLN